MDDIVFLSVAEERELAILGLAGDAAARNRVVLNIYPWVVKRAQRYAGRVPHADLVQHAMAMCVEKFHLLDLSRVTRPMSYLTVTAERQMQFMTKRDGIIVRPVGKSHTSQETKDAATRVETLTSLSTPSYEGADLADVVPDRIADQPSGDDEATDHATHFLNRLKILPPRWAEVIRLRFVDGKKLRETGEALGITKERARQIESKALNALKKHIQDGDYLPALRPVPDPLPVAVELDVAPDPLPLKMRPRITCAFCGQEFARKRAARKRPAQLCCSRRCAARKRATDKRPDHPYFTPAWRKSG